MAQHWHRRIHDVEAMSGLGRLFVAVSAGHWMVSCCIYVEGHDRNQVTLPPECLDDYIAQDNTVRLIDAFIAELNIATIGFGGAMPAETGRPSYYHAVILKLYLYGYLNRITSSRRLERECQRNVCWRRLNLDSVNFRSAATRPLQLPWSTRFG